jgi:hypothetical protein
MASNSPALVVPAPTAGPTNGVVAQDIREVKPPVAIPTGWAWLGWLLGFAALVAVAWWSWRKWLKSREKPAVTIVIPPHVIARDQLRAALELLDRPEPFCVAVSGIVRNYLEAQFRLQAPERTTEEFLEELQSSAMLDLNLKRLLGDFLMRCDLVKFAQAQPSRDELRELYDSALRLVEETTPSALNPLPTSVPAAAAEPAAPAAAGGGGTP